MSHENLVCYHLCTVYRRLGVVVVITQWQIANGSTQVSCMSLILGSCGLFTSLYFLIMSESLFPARNKLLCTVQFCNCRQLSIRLAALSSSITFVSILLKNFIKPFIYLVRNPQICWGGSFILSMPWLVCIPTSFIPLVVEFSVLIVHICSSVLLLGCQLQVAA